MLDPVLRPVKDRLLEPLARSLGWLHPHAITALALGAGVAAAAAAWYDAFLWGFVLWGLNRLLDGLDGVVARTHGTTSDEGGYFDLVGDFVVYAAIPVGLALRPSADPGLPAAALLLMAAFYVNATTWMVLSSLLEKRGRGVGARGGSTSVAIPEGLVAGTETALFYALFFLLPGRLAELFLVMAALTAVTAVQRVLWGTRALRG